jgi:hypothetical protein
MALRVVLALAVVVLLAPPAVSGASEQQAVHPRTVLLRQATLLKQAKWREMYATYTARFRRTCPYAAFVRNARRTRQVLGPEFELRGIRVRMETPRRALLAYTFARGRRTIATVTFQHRDVYVRIGSRWFDELDRVSTC